MRESCCICISHSQSMPWGCIPIWGGVVQHPPSRAQHVQSVWVCVGLWLFCYVQVVCTPPCSLLVMLHYSCASAIITSQVQAGRCLWGTARTAHCGLKPAAQAGCWNLFVCPQLQMQDPVVFVAGNVGFNCDSRTCVWRLALLQAGVPSESVWSCAACMLACRPERKASALLCATCGGRTKHVRNRHRPI